MPASDSRRVGPLVLPLWARAIRAWRLRNGWEQKTLAHRLNLLDRTCRCDHVTVSRWERGLQKPTPIYEELLCRVFERAVVDAAAIAPDDRRGIIRQSLGFASPGVGLAAHAYADPVRRREFVRLAALGGVGLVMDFDRVLSVLSGRNRADLTLLDELEGVTREFGRLYWTERPATLLRAADDHLAVIRGVFAMGPWEPLAGRVVTLASEAACLCGWLAVRVNRRAEAVMYLALALELAAEAGASHLRAHGLVAMRALCSPLITDDRHAEATRALALMNEAAHLGGHASPLLRTEVFACRAEEWAMAGQAAAAERDLDRAEVALAGARTPSADFFSDWTADRLAHYRGTCAVLLRRPAEAIPVLQSTIERTSPALVAPYSAAVADLAAAYAQDGEVERSCELLEQVLTLAIEAGMPQRVNRVRRTRRQHLQRWGGASSVRRLDERLGSF